MARTISLVIGNKNTSSWSLRPWLVLKHAAIKFTEIPVRLREPETKQNILRHSPSGLVPVLKVDDLTVWDSLAIAEYVAESCPDKHLWPTDQNARAVARAASAEMHAGFSSLRGQMPMEILSRAQGGRPTVETARDIDRIQHIWQDCRARFGHGGRFLFGDWSIADAMFAPVVTRFRTYGIKGEGENADYMDAVLNDPPFREWESDCVP